MHRSSSLQILHGIARQSDTYGLGKTEIQALAVLATLDVAPAADYDYDPEVQLATLVVR